MTANCKQDGKVEVPVESLSEVRSRLQEGTVKRVLLDALEEAGPAGLNVASLVDAVQVSLPLRLATALVTFKLCSSAREGSMQHNASYLCSCLLNLLQEMPSQH